MPLRQVPGATSASAAKNPDAPLLLRSLEVDRNPPPHFFQQQPPSILPDEKRLEDQGMESSKLNPNSFA